MCHYDRQQQQLRWNDTAATLRMLSRGEGGLRSVRVTARRWLKVLWRGEDQCCDEGEEERDCG